MNYFHYHISDTEEILIKVSLFPAYESHFREKYKFGINILLSSLSDSIWYLLIRGCGRVYGNSLMEMCKARFQRNAHLKMIFMKLDYFSFFFSGIFLFLSLLLDFFLSSSLSISVVFFSLFFFHFLLNILYFIFVSAGFHQSTLRLWFHLAPCMNLASEMRLHHLVEAKRRFFSFQKAFPCNCVTV